MQVYTKSELQRLYSYTLEIVRQSKMKLMAQGIHKEVIESASKGITKRKFNEIPDNMIDDITDMLTHTFPDSKIHTNIIERCISIDWS
jgi:hypothetical protein